MGQGAREVAADGLGQSGTSSEAERQLAHKFDSLSFAVQKNRRYHEKLLSFYSTWRDRMKVITALAGSGAFLIVVAKIKPWDEVLNAFIALWATLDIIMSPDKKADRSRDLEERFCDLASKIEESDKTEKNYHKFASERIQIEKKELPVKRLVDLEARNDECRARGYPAESQVPLSKWQRMFGYYFTFGLPRLEKWKNDQLAGR